jgi:hypothetical protein
MTTNATDFLQTHAPDGELTPEHAARYLELLTEGDTGAQALESGEPSATDGTAADQGDRGTTEIIDAAATAAPAPAPAAAPAAAPAPAEPNEADLNASNAVILAKSGKHTISYDKLVEARTEARDARADAAAARAELAALQAQAQLRADAGLQPTQTDANAAAADKAIQAGVDPAIFGDFSDEALAKGISILLGQGMQPLLTTVQALQKQVETLQGELVPLKQSQATSASDAHYGSIYKAHPDADSIAQSQELAAWIGAQPTFARAGFQAVLANGSAAEVIELFDEFKKATGAVQAAAPAPALTADPKAAARAAIAAAPTPAPASLSEIPGGAAGPGSRFEAMASMSGPALAEALESMSEEQREAFLNRST